jgi:hypothetical protein
MGQTFVYNTGNSKAAVDELHLQFGVWFDISFVYPNDILPRKNTK